MYCIEHAAGCRHESNTTGVSVGYKAQRELCTMACTQKGRKHNLIHIYVQWNIVVGRNKDVDMKVCIVIGSLKIVFCTNINSGHGIVSKIFKHSVE